MHSISELSRFFSKKRCNILNDFVHFAFKNFSKEQLKDFFLDVVKPRKVNVYKEISIKISPEIEKIFKPIAENLNLKITHIYTNILIYMYNFALKNPYFSYKRIVLNAINAALEDLKPTF